MSTAEEKARGLDGPTQRRERMLERSQRAIEVLERAVDGYPVGGVELNGIKIRLPTMAGGEGLVIITGLDAEGTPVVAFHSATTFVELFVGLCNRLENGSLKWRFDEYASK